jgi:hypothetical protein
MTKDIEEGVELLIDDSGFVLVDNETEETVPMSDAGARKLVRVLVKFLLKDEE